MESRENLVEELSQEIQRSGTLTVLHTNAIANKVGLSATEFEAFAMIRHTQPISAGQLSAICGLTTGAITGIIDRLERAHCVRRAHDPADRRRVLVEPVENREMREQVQAYYEPIYQEFLQFVDSFTPEQMRFLVETYQRMNDILEKMIVDLHEK